MPTSRAVAVETVTVEIPTSKSESHRLLICAGLAQGAGASQLCDLLDCDDTRRTREVLAAAGARFEQTGMSDWSVAGMPAAVDSMSVDVFVGESGSTCRFMAAVLASRNGGEFRVHGAGRMHERPMAPLLDVLRAQGCVITCEDKPGCAPFVMCPTGLLGGVIEIETTHTNQYLSGLLMAAPMAYTPVEIVPVGTRIASWPYVPLTLRTMEHFGARVEVLINGHSVDWRILTEAPLPEQVRFRVANAGYTPTRGAAEPDWSAASYFMAAGALGPLGLHLVPAAVRSLQADFVIADILRQMGADIVLDENAGGVCAVSAAPPDNHARLHGVCVEMGNCPDIVPTVVMCALFADGETRITGVEHLKIKECDRGAVLARELAKIGADVRVDGGTLTVQPLRRDLRGVRADLCTHGDHRMAMCFSLLELHGAEVVLDDTACVAKSFPGFWEQWSKVRAAL